MTIIINDEIISVDVFDGSISSSSITAVAEPNSVAIHEGKWNHDSFSVTSHTHDYLSLTGGTLTGSLNIYSSSSLTSTVRIFSDTDVLTENKIISTDDMSMYPNGNTFYKLCGFTNYFTTQEVSRMEFYRQHNFSTNAGGGIRFLVKNYSTGNMIETISTSYQQGIKLNSATLINGNLTVTGTTSINNYLPLTGGTVSGTLSTTGTTWFAGNNYVRGLFDYKPLTNALNSFAIWNKDWNLIFSVDTLNERVGIGTATPTSKLSVIGSVSVTGTTSISGNASITGSLILNKSGSVLSDNSPFTVEVDADLLNPNTTAFYIYPKDSTQHRMFFGKSGRTFYSLDLSYVESIVNPPTIYSLIGSGDNSDSIGLGNAKVGTGIRRRGHTFVDGTRNQVDFFASDSNSYSVGFNWFLNPSSYYSENQKDLTGLVMTISADGNVGINTPTPSSKLSVSGDTSVTGNLSVVTSTGKLIIENYSIDGYMRLYSPTSNIIFGNSYKSGPGLSFWGSAIDMTGVNYVYMSTQIWSGVATLGQVGNDIQFDIATTGSSYGVKGIAGQVADIFYVKNISDVKLFSVSANGNVSISGNTSITGEDVVFNVRRLKATGAQDEVMRLSNSGTYEGNFRFKIGSENARGGRLQFYEGDSPASYIDPDVYDLRFGSNQGSIEFYTNLTSKKMVISNDGNVGINTPTPSSKLSVSGNASVTGSLVIKPPLYDRYVDYQKPDGTSLMYSMWDTGNWHHYFSSGMYWNMNGTALTIDDSVGSGGIRITGKASIIIDPPVDGSVYAINDGQYSYATVGVPLTQQGLIRAQTYAWNGSNGYEVTSYSSIFMKQESYSANTASLNFQIGNDLKFKLENSISEYNNTEHQFTGDMSVTGDIEVADLSKGVILRSPDNSRWRISVDNSGSLTAISI